MIAGFSRDKDIDAILTIISRMCSTMIAVKANNDRALPSDELCRSALMHRIDAAFAGDILQAMNDAIANAEEGSTILLTGSHFVVGEFLQRSSL